MALFRRLFIAAAVAGVLSGLSVGIIHQLITVPIIYTAEVFEERHDGPVHVDHDGWRPRDGVERTSYTILADLLGGIGFSLLLVAAYAVAGVKMSAWKGVKWGVAAFVVFVLAPSLGLPPELPGSSAAPLIDKQLWWVSTVMLTIIGLAVLSRRPADPLTFIAAILAILFLHEIGAPKPMALESAVPAFLADRFVAATIISGLLFWIAAGALTGLLYQRLLQSFARAD
jgi:cobalt transporter subunit CbtA